MTCRRCLFLRIAPSLVLVCGVVIAMSARAAAKDAPARPLPPVAKKKVDFARDVATIFAKHCNDCHGPDTQEGRLRLDAKKIVLKGGLSGPAIVLRNSKASLLVRRLVAGGDEDRMPLDADPLTDGQIGLIRAWIDQGAKWPESADLAAGKVKGADHWSFQPIARPALPAVNSAAWVRNEIDYFILARLEAKGIGPSKQASRETLARRVSLDLRGLPPTLKEVDGFVNDTSPKAYERMVDRILSTVSSSQPITKEPNTLKPWALMVANDLRRPS